MTSLRSSPPPELYPPKPLTVPLAFPVIVVIGLACLTGDYLTNSVMAERPPVATQLDNGIVTFVDSHDQTGVKSPALSVAGQFFLELVPLRT